MKEDENDQNDFDLELTEIDKEISDDFKTKFELIKNENNQLSRDVFSIMYEEKMKINEELFKNRNKDNNNNYDDDNEETSLDVDIELTLKDFKFNKFGISLNTKKCDIIYNFQYPIIAVFPYFPFLQFRILPLIDIENCFEKGFEFEQEKGEKEEISLIEDKYLKAEVSISTEVGLYIPETDSGGFQISFRIGLKGILGSGKIGMKLSINLKNNYSEQVKYYEYQVIQLYAYILFEFKLDLGIYSFSFKFYLYKENIYSACKKCKGKGLIK